MQFLFGKFHRGNCILWFVSGIAVASGCGIVLWQQFRSRDSGPDSAVPLRIEPSEAKLVRAGASAAASQLVPFRVSNSSTRTIRLQSVTSTCGCMRVKKPLNPELAPGSSVQLQVEAHLPPFGKRTSWIRIRTDDAQQEYLIPIHLQGEMVETPHIQTVPKRLEISGAVPGETAQFAFEIVAIEFESSEPWVTGFQTNNTNMRAVVCRPPSASNHGVGLSYRTYSCLLNATIPPANTVPVSGWLQVTTRNPGPPHPTRIPVFVKHQPPVRMEPRQLFFSRKLLTEAGATRTVALVCESAEPFDVKVLPTGIAWLTAEPVDSTAQRAKLVRICVPTPPDRTNVELRTIRHNVRIQTSVAGAEELTLPVTVELP